MAGAHIEAAAVVAVAADQFGHGVALEISDLLVVVVPLQVVDVTTSVIGIRWLVVWMRDAGFEVAIDLVFRDQVFRQVLGGFGQFPELARHVPTGHAGEFNLILALTATELPAIASGSAPAGFARLQQNYIVAAFGEMQG